MKTGLTEIEADAGCNLYSKISYLASEQKSRGCHLCARRSIAMFSHFQRIHEFNLTDMSDVRVYHTRLLHSRYNYTSRFAVTMNNSGPSASLMMSITDRYSSQQH